MCLIQVAALRSEDPSTKVGALILDADNRVVSMGYNGLPRGLSLDDFPLDKRPEKYLYVCHAEMNAILFADRNSLKGAKMYAPFLPCPRCTIEAIQVGITEVIYATKFESKADNFDGMATAALLHKAGVALRYYEPNVGIMTITADDVNWAHGAL